MGSCGFGLGPGDSKVDFACFGRREGAGNVLEGPVLGLWDEEDDEEQKEDQQPDEHQERVLFQFNLHDAKQTKFVLM